MQSPALLCGGDEAVQLDDAILYDHVEKSAVQPILLADLRQERLLELGVAFYRLLGLRLALTQGLHDIGARDDADQLAVAHDRKPLHSPLFEGVGEDRKSTRLNSSHVR